MTAEDGEELVRVEPRWWSGLHQVLGLAGTVLVGPAGACAVTAEVVDQHLDVWETRLR